MKKVFIFGDSNVWGDNFITNTKLDDDKRWVNVLQNDLKKKVEIFYDGLPGRVAGDIEKTKIYKNGKRVFPSSFRVHAPFDCLIIALGTNDLQRIYNRSSIDIYRDLMWYKEMLEEVYKDDDDRQKYFKNKFPKIIYILPARFDTKKVEVILDDVSLAKRQDLIGLFKDSGVNYIILEQVDLCDGIHFSAEGHLQVAKRVGGFLDELY